MIGSLVPKCLCITWASFLIDMLLVDMLLVVVLLTSCGRYLLGRLHQPVACCRRALQLLRRAGLERWCTLRVLWSVDALMLF